MLCAMQWAAEVLEAEVAAVVTEATVVHVLGFPRDHAPVAALLAAGREPTHLLRLPRVGELRSISVPIDEIGAHLVVARWAARDSRQRKRGCCATRSCQP